MIFDHITLQVGTAETLSESILHCATNEKDFYLYYFLKPHPGRTVVFCNRCGLNIFTVTRENILTCPKNIQHRLRAAAGQPVLAAGRVAAGAARAAAPEAAPEEPRQVLLRLQVSCDWWRAGHVTTVLNLIGSPGVCSSPPTWPPGASTSPTLNTSSTIRSYRHLLTVCVFSVS